MPYKVAFLGFSDFERSALASYFRLAHNRTPQYRQVPTLTDADFLVADADHLPSVHLLLATERCTEAVFIGSAPPPGCTAWMARPIDALRVMRELDAMVGLRVQRTSAQAAEVAPAMAPAAGRAAITTTTTTMSAAPAAAPAAAAAVGRIAADAAALSASRRAPDSGTGSGGPSGASRPFTPPAQATADTRPARPVPPQPAPPADSPLVLLVDADAEAAVELVAALGPWRLQIEHASGSSEAEALLARRPYDLVFVGVDLGGDSPLDGLALCQRIKQSVSAMGTAVILSSNHPSELDRVRGTFAGCDAYLCRPLDDVELHRALRKQGLTLPRDATAPTGGSVQA